VLNSSNNPRIIGAIAVPACLLCVWGAGLGGCATLDREPQATLSLSGFHKEAVKRSFSTMAHSGQGVATNFEHDDGEGMVYSMHFSTHHSHTVEQESSGSSVTVVPGGEADIRPGDIPPPVQHGADRYWLSSMGAAIGYYSRYFGGALGVHFVSGPSGDSGGNNFDNGILPLPWFELRAGDLETGWAELRAGPKLGLNDGILVYLGAGFGGKNLSGSLGFGVTGNVLVNFHNSGIDLDGGDLAGAGSLQWLADAGWGVALRTTIGESYSIAASIVLDLERMLPDDSL